MLQQSLRRTWEALRAKKQEQGDILGSVRVKNLRGIGDLRVAFDSPVAVLAGPNGCGKSTVLFACAAAYEPSNQNRRLFTPASLFPGFRSELSPELSDQDHKPALEFHYVAGGEQYSMVWKRGDSSWNKSYLGRKGLRQPGRQVYFRTSTSLTNPSEVGGLLQLPRRDYDTEDLDPELLLFAGRILPQQYRRVSLIRGPRRDLLFAGLKTRRVVRYSEFHMSAGERAVLRMSKDVSNLRNAIVLIDEIEAGLHPWTQQRVMLELQRTALRNDLQVIVTTHSPVVLDSVPPEGRIFLDRDADTMEVRRVPAYRDIFQKALYGQSTDRLSILCEDEVAEGLILGALDVLNPRLGTRRGDFVIGRDTGSAEFAGHVHAFGKFGKLDGFLFVLGGDAERRVPALQAAASQYGHRLDPLLLPGPGSPEAWIWRRLEARPGEYARAIGVAAADLEGRMAEIDRTFAGEPAIRTKDVPKVKVQALADELARGVPALARIVGRLETELADGRLRLFAERLEDQIQSWRRLGGG